MAEPTEKVLTWEQAIDNCIEAGTHERRSERDPQCRACPGKVFEATYQQCDRQGKHVVYPTVWPPENPDGTKYPSAALACDRCGVWIIVYDKPMKGVKVVKPQAVKEG